MSDKNVLHKFTLLTTTRCNLKCRLCSESIPYFKPFPDMTVDEARKILSALFDTVDSVDRLHLSGGGEPFLHPRLHDMIDLAFEYSDYFDELMVFTNSLVKPSPELLDAFSRHQDAIIVQLSLYGINPAREHETLDMVSSTGVKIKAEKYYGENQSFGGWVDFGEWKAHGRSDNEQCEIFSNCAVTRDMRGNLRTRDGKVHWCSRSQRGTELGLIPDFAEDYVDLFEHSSREEKREKFRRLLNARSLFACDYCSGEQGTSDASKRYPAAEQL